MFRAVKRVRVLCRLPDYEGKYRDEMTQELEVEADGETLDQSVEAVTRTVEAELREVFAKVKALGGADYLKEVS